MRLLFKSIKHNAIFYWDGNAKNGVLVCESDIDPKLRHQYIKFKGPNLKEVTQGTKPEFYIGTDKYLILHRKR